MRFEGVSFAYQGGGSLPVLDQLDLTIEAGESVALVGATGSGKSTVARLLPRFYDVDSGTVRLDGVDVRDLGLGERLVAGSEAAASTASKAGMSAPLPANVTCCRAASSWVLSSRVCTQALSSCMESAPLRSASAAPPLRHCSKL